MFPHEMNWIGGLVERTDPRSGREDRMKLEDIRIYFIGDSYVNGTGDPAYLGWPGRACAASRSDETSITCYNLGIRGDTSIDVLRRWEREVETRRLIPHDGRVVFGFGANDCWIVDGKTRVDRGETIRNTEEILSRARSLFPTLMIGPPPGIDDNEHGRRVEISSLVGEIAGRTGVPYLEVIHELHAGGIWKSEAALGDRVHPADGGYFALAELVLAWPEWWFNAPSNAP